EQAAERASANAVAVGVREAARALLPAGTTFRVEVAMRDDGLVGELEFVVSVVDKRTGLVRGVGYLFTDAQGRINEWRSPLALADIVATVGRDAAERAMLNAAAELLMTTPTDIEVVHFGGDVLKLRTDQMQPR